jgi:hypothetical protein
VCCAVQCCCIMIVSTVGYRHRYCQYGLVIKMRNSGQYWKWKGLGDRFTTRPNYMYIIGRKEEVVQQHCCKSCTGSYKNRFIGQ